MSEYEPGVCNIGQDERRKRRVTGLLGFGGAVVYLGWMVATGRPDTFAVGVFPFLFAGVLGILQDRMRFCVGFAALARYDLSGSGGDTGRSTDAAAVRRDRLRALKILGATLILAGVGTGLVYAVATLA
jgi:hypothetical protein